MKGLSRLIRDRRRSLGFTQVGLAQAAGVSLPTIQNLEAGKGNPSLQVLEPTLDALHLSITVRPKSADWNRLALLGVPILVGTGAATRDSAGSPEKPSAGLLISELRLAALEITGPDRDAEHERKREALGALVAALVHHFPDFYARHFRASQAVQELAADVLPGRITGRVIKLKRQALARLAEYL